MTDFKRMLFLQGYVVELKKVLGQEKQAKLDAVTRLESFIAEVRSMDISPKAKLLLSYKEELQATRKANSRNKIKLSRVETTLLATQHENFLLKAKIQNLEGKLKAKEQW